MCTSSKRFKNIVTAFALGTVVAFGLAPPAHAVHSGFELDANTADSPAGAPDDWENFNFSTDPNPKGTSSASAATGIVEDVDAKVFTQGSKDTKNINQWAWRGGSSPPKADLTDAYAAAYQPGSDLIVYFGANRDSNNGTTTTGFWFFKNEITTNANGTFNGVHANGDVLAVFNYDNGGHVGKFVIYKWQNGALTKVVEGINQLGTPGILCVSKTGSAGDDICGLTNSATTEIPWASQVPPGGFFEGGINMSQVIGGDTCFASFMATSRSSTTENAEIKNFILGRFPVCGIAVTKVCKNPALVDATHVRYTIEGMVTSTGSGSVSNVTLSDSPAAEAAFDAYACDNGLPTGSSTGTFPVATLAGNGSVCYRTTFLSTTNGGSDTVHATASAGSVSLTADATAECPQLEQTGALTIDKACSTAVEVNNNQVVVRVNYTYGANGLCNTGDFDLTNVQVFNDKPAADTLVKTIPTLAQGACDTDLGTHSYLPALIETLVPGQDASNPLCARFSDQLSAHGTGPAILGSPTVSTSQLDGRASCPLCPGGTCPAP